MTNPLNPAPQTISSPEKVPLEKVTLVPKKPVSLPGPNIMLMGPSGTGKTHSIGTLVETGIEVFYFAYEAGTESLIGYFTDQGKPVPPNLHICSVVASSASFSEMADNVKNTNSLSLDALLKSIDSNRTKYNQYEKFLRSFNNVTDDNGVSYGAVDTFGTNRALVIDGLTGMCDSAMKSVIGGKFVRGQNEWGTAQNMVEGTLRKLTSECRCLKVLIAHVERETDPNGGGTKLMASALGKALAPKLPAMFSDVILAKRLGREFFWDTVDPAADLKTRNLPLHNKIPPNFSLILEKWKSRGGVM